MYITNGSEAQLFNSSGEFVKKLEVETAQGVAVDPSDDHAFVDEGHQISEFDSAGNSVGNPIGAGALSDSTGLAAEAESVLRDGYGSRHLSVFGPSAVLPNPRYDNPAVLDAVGEAETRHTADFQVTPSADFAAFSSKLPLTGYDNNEHAEVFRYTAAGEAIDCVSCAPTGARATGDASLAMNGLSLAEDGKVFFNSTDPLIPSDLNGAEDAFEWSDGKIGPISSGTSPLDSSLLSISAHGTDASSSPATP